MDQLGCPAPCLLARLPCYRSKSQTEVGQSSHGRCIGEMLWFSTALCSACFCSACACLVKHCFNSVVPLSSSAVGGPARLFSPLVAKPLGAPAAEDLPLMFYMPGIDGTGLAAYRQFPRLTQAFDLRCLIVPRTDRSTFEQLVDDVAVSIARTDCPSS